MTFMIPETIEEMDLFEKRLAESAALAHQKFLEADTLHKKKELWFSTLRKALPREDRLELARILVEARILKRPTPKS